MSAIDPSKPVFGNPTTLSVRENFGFAKAEIEALDAGKADRTQLTAYLPLAGGTMTGALTLAAAPASAMQAATRRYVDNAPFLPLAGGTLTGPLSLAADPTTPAGAATRRYVDAQVQASTDAAIARFLPLAGGTMTGQLLLSADPIDPRGAATRRFVEETVSGVAGITEAPNDGYSYGRGSIAWQQVLRLTGGSLSGKLTINGVNDGLEIVAPENGYARLRTHVVNERIWSAGVGSGGAYVITDETVASDRLRIDTGGNVTVVIGSVFAAGGFFIGGTTDFGTYSSAGHRVHQWAATWWDGWDVSNGTRLWTAPAGTLMTLDGAGNLGLMGAISAGWGTFSGVTGGASVTAGYLSSSGNADIAGTLWANVMSTNGITAGNATVHGTLGAGAVSTGSLVGLWDLAIGGR